MIMQLAAICLLTSLAWIPYVVTIIVSIFGHPSLVSTVLFFHLLNATYVPNLGTPFFALIGFPHEIREKMFTCVIFLRRKRGKGNSRSKTTRI
jgi:hypothetical protein